MFFYILLRLYNVFHINYMVSNGFLWYELRISILVLNLFKYFRSHIFNILSHHVQVFLVFILQEIILRQPMKKIGRQLLWLVLSLDRLSVIALHFGI